MSISSILSSAMNYLPLQSAQPKSAAASMSQTAQSAQSALSSLSQSSKSSTATSALSQLLNSIPGLSDDIESIGTDILA